MKILVSKYVGKYGQCHSQNGIIFTHTQEKVLKKKCLESFLKQGLLLKERICS